MRNLVFLLAVAVLVCSGTANATIITDTYTASYGFTGLNSAVWGSPVLTIPQFDTTRGTLQSISFLLEGWIAGTMQIENMDVTADTFTQTLAATLTLTRPDTSTLAVTLPSISQSFYLQSYDGTKDYAGTSGVTYNVAQSQTIGSSTYKASTQLVLTPLSGTWASDYSLFTGLGSVNLPLLGTSTSTTGSSGYTDYSAKPQATAFGKATVVYTYDRVTPEPSTMFLLGSALVAVGVFWRKKTVH